MVLILNQGTNPIQPRSAMGPPNPAVLSDALPNTSFLPWYVPGSWWLVDWWLADQGLPDLPEWYQWGPSYYILVVSWRFVCCSNLVTAKRYETGHKSGEVFLNMKDLKQNPYICLPTFNVFIPLILRAKSLLFWVFWVTFRSKWVASANIRLEELRLWKSQMILWGSGGKNMMLITL